MERYSTSRMTTLSDSPTTATTRGAARRQELDLDNPPPLDASGNLAERVRATFTAEADADAEEDADAGRMPVDVPPVWTGRSQRPS